MADLRHIDGVNEEANDNGRRRKQHVVKETRGGRQPAAAAIFGQIGARQHADRRADQCAHQRHHDAAQDGIEQAAVGARRWRAFRQQ